MTTAPEFQTEYNTMMEESIHSVDKRINYDTRVCTSRVKLKQERLQGH